ncbi:MAG: hypothetical protein QM762_28665 [Chryseolinea sp.]
MKRITPFIALLLIGCAAPKYSYYFDHYQVTQRPDAIASTSGTSEGNAQNSDTRKGDTRQARSQTRQTSAANQQAALSQSPGISTTNSVNNVTSQNSPLRINPDNMLADARINTSVIVSKGNAVANTRGIHEQQSNERLTAKHLTKEDRKELIRALKQLRKEIRSKPDIKSNAPLHDQATQKLDKGLIVAISFAAVGITLSILGGLGAGFWIAGVICLGLGVYFFIDWLQNR